MKISDGILANLLANENLTIQSGNVETASFDVHRRVLTMPFWADASKDVTHMLIGHEVGHALYTPRDTHDALKRLAPGVPFDYINIVEDVRIERKMLEKYPGLIGNFKRGYKELFDGKDFFGTPEKIVRLPFPDRLNSKMKLRDLIDIPFTDEEKVLVEQVRACETFRDVIAASIAIYEFMKDQKDAYDQDPQSFMEDLISQLTQDLDQSDSSSSDGQAITVEAQFDQDGGETGDAEEGEGSGSDSSEDGAGDGDGKGEDDGKEGEGDASDLSDLPSEMNIDQVATQQALDQAASEKTEKKQGKIYGNGAGSLSKSERYFSTATVLAKRKDRADTVAANPKVAEAFKEFTIYSDKAVNQMVAEFERRRSAARYARAETSRSGSLDTSKLHKYLLSDDIFSTHTILEDDKAHGIVMLVDFSGSMWNALPTVLRRLIILVKFCKKANIKFRVLSFTSRGVVEMFHDAMSKKDLALAIKQVFLMTVETDGSLAWHYERLCVEEDLGGTPLVTTTFEMEEVFKKYLADKAIQKYSFITLTDGESERYYPYANYSANTEVFMGEVFRFSRLGYGSAQMKGLLDILRSKGFKTCNFFVKTSGSPYGRSKGSFKVEYDVDGYDVKFTIPLHNSRQKDVDKDLDTSMSVAALAKAMKSMTNHKTADKLISREIAKLIG
jgi:hypothetical protein